MDGKTLIPNSISDKERSNFTNSSDLHKPKALVSILVTDEGIVILHNDKHSQKHWSPIEDKKGGSSIYSNEKHLPKA